jgi:hypothetical protein
MQQIKSMGLDGVVYFSKNMPDYRSIFHGVNIAILATAENEEQEYFDLKNNIELTSPKSFNRNIVCADIVKGNYKSFCNHFFRDRDCRCNPNQNGLVVIDGEEYSYTETKYLLFDEYLLRQKFGKCTG